MGLLNFELHCELVPLACENFITHCESGYYKNVKFHRNIRHFMIQGGDPSATGKGGESIWGKDFPDEFVKTLKHDGIGVLSMANSGKNTNGSQFFILYKSAPHLDNKHTVFGKLVGGFDVLKTMALIESDEYDRPVQDIVILDTTVYFNPFSKEEMQKEKLEEETKQKKEKEKQEFGQWLSNPQPLVPVIKTNENGIGKYLASPSTQTTKTLKRHLDFGSITQTEAQKKSKRQVVTVILQILGSQRCNQ